MLWIRYRVVPLAFLLTLFLPAAAQKNRLDSVTYSLFLIGDAGEPYVEKSPIGKVLRNMAGQYQGKAMVVYLGDNIYPGGLSSLGMTTREQGEKVLNIQSGWIRGLNVKGIFIPGNHDWAHWGSPGLQYILHQQEWIDSLKEENITLLPRDGCPGPVELRINEELTVVILDTQWFLHQWDKPGLESGCENKTPEEVLSVLNDILYRNRNRRVVITGHHPLITYGTHGGYFSWKNHLFPLLELNPHYYLPLPVLGTVGVMYRKYFGHIQDATHPVYRELSQEIQQIMKEYPNTIYAAGHDHNLQYIHKNGNHFVVSGAGSKYSYVRKKGYSEFAKAKTGFARLDLFRDGSSELRFFQVDDDFPEGKELFITKIPAVERKASGTPPALRDFSRELIAVQPSEQYRASRFKQKLLGENYRKEWSTVVKVPMFDIGKTYGGLKVLQKGGGQQTLSLRLSDTLGHEYVIRSVEKYPEKAVPEMLRKTFAQDLVQDQISASHPFAALVIPPLAEAAGIYHTNPKMFFVPDDPRLGEYQQEFANTLVLFEERPDNDWSNADFFGNSKKIISTAKVLEKMYDDNDNQVDQEFTVKSRLFDMIIGDWDRHDDQWRWATFKGKKGDVFRPIPRDRDQAFFVNEGMLSTMWSRRWALPKFEGFKEEVRWPSGLSFNARYFDRSFLNGLSKDQWVQAANELKLKLTDSAIEQAIRQWPLEIFNEHGEQVIARLKSRRDKIVGYAQSHYEFLAREVDVVGSNKNELFSVIRNEDGSTQVIVQKITKDGTAGKTFFDRTFQREETREVRLYGLGGDDRFEFAGDADEAILVRVIAGEGKDELKDVSHIRGIRKSIVYYDSESPSVESANIKDRSSHRDVDVNTYDRKSFQYNRLAPLLYGNYNPDDGVFVGAGFLNINHGFRKNPFKSRHMFLASVAPLTRSYNFGYKGKFTEVVGKWDFNIQADLKSPNYVNNFFGLGNETVFNRDIEETLGIDVHHAIDYYRYRFEELRLEASLSRKIGANGLVSIGPALQRIEMEDRERGDHDRYIYDYGQSLDSKLFDEYHSYGGVNWQFIIDQRDNPRLTMRGITFQVNGRNLAALNRDAKNLSSYEASLGIIHSFRSHGRLVFAVRSGAGFNTGKYAFYQAQILDGRTELRGYRKTRFYGDSKFYSNFEVRLRLLKFQSYLFPAHLGVLGFHDLGRVWYKDANGVDPSTATGKSNMWHKGFGGGIWFTPFNLTVLSTEFAHSADGNMAYVRLGFLF